VKVEELNCIVDYAEKPRRLKSASPKLKFHILPLTDFFSVVKGLIQGLRFVNTQLTKFQVGIHNYNLGQNKKEQLTHFPR